MNTRTISALFVALTITATALAAQDSTGTRPRTNDELVPGSRVRFSVLEPDRRDWAARPLLVRGTLTDVRTDSLRLEVGGSAGSMTVPRSALVNLSISQGMQRGWRVHPGRTVLSGLVFASSVALFALTQDDSRRNARTPDLVLRGGITALNGYFFARTAFSKTERWERVR
jgi:hypothetical protein